MVVLRVQGVWDGPLVRGGGVSTWWFRNPSTDAQACTDATEDFINAALSGVLSTNGITLEASVQVFNETDGELLSVQAVTPPARQAGTATGSAMAPTTQGLFHLITAGIKNNRIVRGRLFWPGPTETFNGTDGRPTGSYITDMGSAASGLIADATANWCVYARPVAGSGGQVNDVVSATIWTEWAVLRSRRD